MATLVTILIILIWLSLVWLQSVPLDDFFLSDYEQRSLRAVDKGNARLKIAQVFSQLKILFELKIAGLILILGLLLTWRRNGWAALLIGVVLLLLAALLASLQPVQRWSEKLFWRLSDPILKIQHFLEPLLKMLTAVRTETPLFSTRQELLDIVARHQTGLSEREGRLVTEILTFTDKKVKDKMVKRSKIIGVKASDMLGPKLVDQLHASGFSQFPVYSGSFDSPVGTLFLADIADVKVLSGSPKVSDLMRKSVYFLNLEDDLPTALRACLSTGVQQFLVVDERQKIRGLIGLGDILDNLAAGDEQPSLRRFDDIAEVANQQPEDYPS